MSNKQNLIKNSNDLIQFIFFEKTKIVHINTYIIYEIARWINCNKISILKLEDLNSSEFETLNNSKLSDLVYGLIA